MLENETYKIRNFLCGFSRTQKALSREMFRIPNRGAPLCTCADGAVLHSVTLKYFTKSYFNAEKLSKIKSRRLFLTKTVTLKYFIKSISTLKYFIRYILLLTLKDF